jgi:hypothetical protein
MTRSFFLSLGTLWILGGLQAQDRENARSAPGGMSNSIAVGLIIPVDVFRQTHHAGLGIDYTRGQNRFGRESGSYSLSKFVLHGGLSYHPGKNSSYLGYEYGYGGYLNAYVMAGADFKPSSPLHLTAVAGPVLGVYKSGNDLGLGVNLVSHYYLGRNISLGPGVFYRKFGKTNALWSGTFRASYSF